MARVGSGSGLTGDATGARSGGRAWAGGGEAWAGGPQREERAGEELAQVQRARIVAAMADIVAEQGYVGATVARVVARSGVSRRTFYEQFPDREQCFLAAYDQAVERIAAVAMPAYLAPSKWPARVRAGLSALLDYLDRDPGLSRLVIVESLGAGHVALEHRRRGIAQIIALLDSEGRQAGTGAGPTPLTAEGLVGGVLSLIHARVADGRPLGELLGPLVSMVVLPYLGPAAARRELARTADAAPAPDPADSGRLRAMSDGPAGATRTRAHSSDPLRDLDMRLTYRTLRVLLAIGELGERGVPPSNREVADAAGIRDQGQVSKLLARLRHVGLVENVAGPRAKGEANGWGLTARGVEVRGVLGG